MVAILVGIEWAGDHHNVVVLGPPDRLVDQLCADHPAAGPTHLAGWRKQSGPPAQLACIPDTRHGVLINTRLEAGCPVYPVNPKTVDRHRQAAGARPDAIDALLLTGHDRHELDRLRHLEPDSPLITGTQTAHPGPSQPHSAAGPAGQPGHRLPGGTLPSGP
ncbi:MAG TPA: hypothetical protein DCM14_05460, partial [Clostridiales bacterium UBA8153]|nr:hypothetical protein [Clostridiales bacterium UBA8153]